MLLVVLALAMHALLRQVLEADHTSLLMLFPVPKQVSQKRGGESLCTPKMEYILYYETLKHPKLIIYCTAGNTICHLKHPHSSLTVF